MSWSRPSSYSSSYGSDEDFSLAVKWRISEEGGVFKFMATNMDTDEQYWFAQLLMQHFQENGYTIIADFTGGHITVTVPYRRAEFTQGIDEFEFLCRCCGIAGSLTTARYPGRLIPPASLVYDEDTYGKLDLSSSSSSSRSTSSCRKNSAAEVINAALKRELEMWVRFKSANAALAAHDSSR